MYNSPQKLEMHSHFILILKYANFCFTCTLSLPSLSCHYFNAQIFSILLEILLLKKGKFVRKHFIYMCVCVFVCVYTKTKPQNGDGNWLGWVEKWWDLNMM